MANLPIHYQLNAGHLNQPILLLLHGFMGSNLDFQSSISQLSQQFCCLTVDLPGHGKTPIQTDDCFYTISATATALIDLLNQLNIPNCYLFGYSMGGRLALYLMIHYPQRFKRVVLASASPGLKTQTERSQRLKADFNRAIQLETGNFDQFLTHWYNQPLFKSLKHHPQFHQLFNNRLQNNPLELAKSLRNMGTGVQPSLWHRLANNSLPLLLMVGEQDQKFIAINQEMAQSCPSATLKIIPHCGHNIQFENPEDWIKTIQDFCLISV